MKMMLMAVAMILGLGTMAHAGGGYGRGSYPQTMSPEQALQDLFAKEMKRETSFLKMYMTDLKEANPDYFFADKIEVADIIRLESGGSAIGYSANYLILIRAGYKSNTFQAGYVKATVSYESEDESLPFEVTIQGPAKVTIE